MQSRGRREISALIRVAGALEASRLQALQQTLAQAKAACQLQSDDLLQTILAPKGRWRNSNPFSKHAVQLGYIAKSHRDRNVGNR
jgi:hypothetical protein